jgi:hypothetical protein
VKVHPEGHTSNSNKCVTEHSQLLSVTVASNVNTVTTWMNRTHEYLKHCTKRSHNNPICTWSTRMRQLRMHMHMLRHSTRSPSCAVSPCAPSHTKEITPKMHSEAHTHDGSSAGQQRPPPDPNPDLHQGNSCACTCTVTQPGESTPKLHSEVIPSTTIPSRPALHHATAAAPCIPAIIILIIAALIP